MASTEDDSTTTITASTEGLVPSAPSEATSSPVSTPSATTSSESPAPPTATTVATEAAPPTGTAAALASANAGFDFLFANDIARARASLSDPSNAASPFHLLGLSICAFLEAALGMESGLMGEASRLLAASEAGAKNAAADAKVEERKRKDGGGRFAPGLEYEILDADAVVLLGLTHALSESYMGYFQCMYALNAPHSKFTKLYKTLFPAGLDAYRTPAPSSAPSRVASSSNLNLTSPPAISVSKSDASSPSVASSRNASSLSVSTLASSSPSPSAPSTPLSASTPPPAAPVPAPSKV